MESHDVQSTSHYGDRMLWIVHIARFFDFDSVLSTRDSYSISCEPLINAALSTIEALFILSPLILFTVFTTIILFATFPILFSFVPPVCHFHSAISLTR